MTSESPEDPRGQAPADTLRADVLEINSRLRHALAEVAERERTIRDQAARNAELYTQLRDSHQKLVTAQRQLIQQERMRALGEMASGVAHDLNNALAPVVGFAELLTQQADVRADSERLLHYLGLILTGASDAAAVVERLREFYRRREEGETFAAVDLNALVQQTIELSQPRWRHQAGAEERRVEVHSELRLIPAAAGSETELREMLMNLVFNAVDALPEGGAITVRTYLDRKTRDRVTLEVSDTGAGMTDEVKQRCLEPFFTTKGERGTGMGMAMVYGTVKRHGGRLEIESTVGQGTTVRIVLPRHGRATARQRVSGRRAA